MTPTATGKAAASRPPNTQTSTRKLKGMASDSISSRSRCDCSVIWMLTMAAPPDRTVTPSRSWATRSDSSLAYFCWAASSPTMPATIRPEVRSLLIRSAAAGGGAVQGEVTSATCGERRSWSTMSTPVVLADVAVDAVGCGDHDQQLHIALIELVGQHRGGPGRLGGRVLEPAGGQVLGDGDAEDAERDRQQRRDDDDDAWRGDGQPSNAVQQGRSSAQCDPGDEGLRGLLSIHAVVRLSVHFVGRGPTISWF